MSFAASGGLPLCPKLRAGDGQVRRQVGDLLTVTSPKHNTQSFGGTGTWGTFKVVDTCRYLTCSWLQMCISTSILSIVSISIDKKLNNNHRRKSLEVKLPTICRDGKAEVGRVSEEKSRSEKIRDGESQKKEDAGVWKGRKVAIHWYSLCFSNDLGLRRVEK